MGHQVKFAPPDGTGYQVCECGATRRVVCGIVVGAWHVCKLCVVRSCVSVVCEVRARTKYRVEPDEGGTWQVTRYRRVAAAREWHYAGCVLQLARTRAEARACAAALRDEQAEHEAEQARSVQ